MEQMRKKQTVLLAGLALVLSAGNGLAAETTTVSTVDSQQLFKSNQLVTDPSKQTGANHQGAEEKITDARPVVQRPLLHWDSLENAQRTQLAVKTSAAPLVVVHKAVPIIITAADIEAQEKAARRKNKNDLVPVVEPVGTLEGNQGVKPAGTTPALTATVPPVPARSAAAASTAATAAAAAAAVPTVPAGTMPVSQKKVPAVQPSTVAQDTVELPPIRAIIEPSASQAVVTSVELPPIQPVASVRSAAAQARSAETVELPPIHPVR